MPRKSFTPEQIITKLRQIEVLIAQGKPVGIACKEAGISEQTYYRWRIMDSKDNRYAGC
jgi:putative transposase